MANELVESSLIEGEFNVEELSGFSCRRCLLKLGVGGIKCPSCGQVFTVPTPTRRLIRRDDCLEKIAALSLVMRHRIPDDEADRIRCRGPLRPPAEPPRSEAPKVGPPEIPPAPSFF